MFEYQRHKIIPQYPAPNRSPKRWFKGLGITSQFPAQCWKSYLFHWKSSELLKGLSIHMEKYKKIFETTNQSSIFKGSKNPSIEVPPWPPTMEPPDATTGHQQRVVQPGSAPANPGTNVAPGLGPQWIPGKWWKSLWVEWKLNGKIMGKPREKHGKTTGKPRENHGKTMGNWWFIWKTTIFLKSFGKSYWFFLEALNGNISNFYCNQWWIFQP